MSDLPILALRFGTHSRIHEFGSARADEPKSQQEQSFWNVRENLSFLCVTVGRHGGNRGKGDPKPMPSTAEASGPAGNDEAYFAALQADGYATDPNYAHALMDMLASVQSLEKHMTRSGAA